MDGFEIVRRLVLAAVLVLLGGCTTHAPERPEMSFSSSAWDLRDDGRLIVIRRGEKVPILLSDYVLPKRGSKTFEGLQRAIRVARAMSIECVCQSEAGDEMTALCLVEGRVPLSTVFAQWGFKSSETD